MTRIPKPCLRCGTLTRNPSKCDNCQKAARSHYTGDYQQRAKHVTQTATTCHLCGQPDRTHLGDPWTADHLHAGDPTSPLLPAHRSCNSKRGNKPHNP